MGLTLIILLPLTSSFIAVITTTATRGLCQTLNITMGHSDCVILYKKANEQKYKMALYSYKNTK